MRSLRVSAEVRAGVFARARIKLVVDPLSLARVACGEERDTFELEIWQPGQVVLSAKGFAAWR